MFCNNGLCSNNSTNFNRGCGCNCGCGQNQNCPCGRNAQGYNGYYDSMRNNSCGCGCNNMRGNSFDCGCNRSYDRDASCGCGCGCSRTNYGCGWYCCPSSPRVTMIVPPQDPSIPPVAAVNLGYFTNASAAGVGANAVIPVTISRQIGTSITSSGTGALLQPGTYKVDFALTGTSATVGATSVGAQLNGVNIPAFTQSTDVAAANALYNLAGTGTIQVTTPNSILNLVNLGANAQDFTDVNLVVKKIV